MKKTDIERVIKQGSIRQKIKLYMTDSAYRNIEFAYNEEGGLLSDKERDIIWSSIKDPQDIKYYEDLRTKNKAFLLFQSRVTIAKLHIKNRVDTLVMV